MMNEKQKRMMDFINSYWKEQYRSPTLREIKDGAGVSSISLVSYHLDKLRLGGQIIWNDAYAISRAIVPAWVKDVIDQHILGDLLVAPDKEKL